ncbi:uncharacterized protein LOC119953686 [Scyliorhinus canicula]|uniref:uncharacterized protein LOC119953686 n=1 Tax=Scyliorhinus canicula TaxID=7830 RepID=UPI0018F70E64|nr:uncharacterized protein LOC119953686 [Scyliorhinus canicula]
MEKDHRVVIGHEKIDEKRNENKEREKERDKMKEYVKERDRERRRSKHKENKKAERREGREKEETMQRRATGGEVRDKKDDEARRKDYEGHMMDHGNGVVNVQSPLSCQEENLIIKEDKPGKNLKSASVHNTRGATADIGSKLRSRDDKHASGQPHHRGERDSRGGGEKILESWEKVALSGAYSETRYGISENHRSMSVERESWGSPSSRRPKYSYRANMDKGEEEGNRNYHEKHYSPSPESVTEPSCRMAHIMHSNINNPDPKVNQVKHRSADKPPRPECKDPNRKRCESRQSPNVHLYMSELVPHPFETKNQTLIDSRPPTEHSKRKSRRSSREETANGTNSQGLLTTDEETLRDEKTGKLVKVRSESPRDIPADMGSKVRSRDDKYFSGHIQSRVERDSKGGGEKILERSEKVPLFNSHPGPRHGFSENQLSLSVEDESWGEPYISPSLQRPKYSYKASMEKGEEIRYTPDTYSYKTPAEPNLRVSQKMEYTVISNIKTPEVKRKHIKHKSLGREHMAIEPGVKEQNIQSGMIKQSPDVEFGVPKSYSKTDGTAEQVSGGFADIYLSPEYPGRKTQKILRDKSSTANKALETWNCLESQSTVTNETDEYSQVAYSVGEIKCLEGWGKGLVYEPQFEAKQRDRCSDGSYEKKETAPQHSFNSRRPRYSYGTNKDTEDYSATLLKNSIAHLSQASDQPVLRITNKSEYMVSSTSTSPEMNRKLIKYTSSLEEQPPALSNFVNKAKQLEVATTMQPVSANESLTVPCLLNSDNLTKDNQQANDLVLDYSSSTSCLHKISASGSQIELSSSNSSDRSRECQRIVYSKPHLHDAADGDVHRERKEMVSGDVKPMASQSTTSLRQRLPSLGMTLTDGTLSVDIPRPIVSTSRKNLLGATYNNEINSNNVRSKPVHFKHQYQECQKRSLQTRKRYQEEVNAALMIQAAWKGYQTRAQIRKQAEAAVIIQAAFRGYQVRKFLTEGISENEIDDLNDLRNEDWQNSEYPEVFLEEISQSDYSESDADSTEDWLESPVSVATASPGVHGNDGLVHEGSAIDVSCSNPLLQYESVYQSQTCNWGGI